jgi:hypothetical protein
MRAAKPRPFLFNSATGWPCSNTVFCHATMLLVRTVELGYRLQVSFRQPCSGPCSLLQRCRHVGVVTTAAAAVHVSSSLIHIVDLILKIHRRRRRRPPVPTSKTHPVFYSQPPPRQHYAPSNAKPRTNRRYTSTVTVPPLSRTGNDGCPPSTRNQCSFGA